MEPRPIYNCHGILVGYMVTNEHGGSFFVQSKNYPAGQCVDMGVNAQYLRDAFRNTDTSALRRAFA